jgi:hypothetical protein
MKTTQRTIESIIMLTGAFAIIFAVVFNMFIR